MKIDFVVLWVDGADSEWRKQKSFYTGVPYVENDIRYRDWEIFHYWFRAVEQYAPWVNRVFLITCGQIPQWLNTQHLKLKLVFHRDYMPEEYLPTFSSHPIELNLHRISDLSEHFVYFNDDMFLNAPVQAEDFFRDGLPRLSAVQSLFVPMDLGNSFPHIMCNSTAFLNTHFKKKEVIKKNPEKWFTLKYGKGLLKNIYFSIGQHGFSVLQNYHMPSPMLKSTFEKVWEMEPGILHETSLRKLRSEKDVNQYIMNYYDIGTGGFVPRDPREGMLYEAGHNSEALYRDLLEEKHKMICINDTTCHDFEGEKRKLISVFEKKFPQKCSFEK
ncbi:MAG: Stealth CR1 domain-containing protein [Clostridia bacterium]|nr:Stealth CR1 domain-containing protein [Clostridia bacterium]